MRRTSLLLALAGAVLAAGLALSFYGNYALFEGMARGEGEVRIGQDLVVKSMMEPNTDGIYAVQLIEYAGEPVTVRVLDPYDMEVGYMDADGELLEGGFVAEVRGEYVLVVSSDQKDAVNVFAVLGPEPDAGAKSLGFVSLYMLVVGLLGMAGVVVFAVISRTRAR